MAQRSVLCWLATVDASGQPNVSPKEIFAILDDEHIVVANIASPSSAKNIRANAKVCLSFIDVFAQKGYKVLGLATEAKPTDAGYARWVEPLRAMAGERFPIHSVFVVRVTNVEPILAPSYRLYPLETSEATQIESALRTYGVQRSDQGELQTLPSPPISSWHLACNSGGTRMSITLDGDSSTRLPDRLRLEQARIGGQERRLETPVRIGYNIQMNCGALTENGAFKNHGLVIIEGIMGSGKSTTMRFVAKALEDAGRPALAIHERTDPHPVRATDELEHWFEPWRDSTAEQLAHRAVSRWRSFAEETQRSASVPVLDGQLFHGDLTHLFLMEASFDELAAYCERLTQVIEPLNPLVIYLRQQDVERAVRIVCAERGEDWVKYQVDWKLKGPYAVRRNLAGLEGLIALYQDYRLMTDALYDRLRLSKMVIENSERDWARYKQQILEGIGLDGVPSSN